MSYIIAMKFLSWVMMLMVAFGFSFIKFCESELKDETSTQNDMVRMGMQNLIEDYNSRSFAGRVLMVLFWGAVMLATPFEIFTKKDEE